MPPTLSQPAPALSPRMHSPPQPAPLTQTVRDGPPPPKRRRAKRTEEERIQYLRSDPFIAQFEAYRYALGWLIFHEIVDSVMFGLLTIVGSPQRAVWELQ